MPPSSRLIYSDFSTGEMSPDALARVDLEATFKGCSELKNMLALQLGGVVRRPALMFVAEVKDSSKLTRLLHFDTAGDTHLVIEVGDLYMRFYEEDGSVVESAPDVPLEVVTPWTEDQVHAIQTAQFEDLLFLVHPDVHPQILSRPTSTTFSLDEYDHVWGPFLDVNIDTSWTISVVTGGGVRVVLTASAPLFEAAHVGTQFYLSDGTTSGYILIDTFTSDTIVEGVIVEPIPSRPFVTSLWAEEAWSGIYGFPGTVAFYQQRAWFSAVRDKPQLFWGSVIADYVNFALGADDDAAIAYRVMSLRREEVVWIAPFGPGLFLGTEHSIMQISGADAAVTPTNIIVQRQSSTGCHELQPISIGNRAFFVDRSQTKLMMFQYDRLSGEQHTAENLNLFANHLGDSLFREIAWAQDALSIFFACMEDGSLVSCSIHPEQGMVAWSSHDNGGVTESVMAGHAGNIDLTWAVVQRTIDGATKRYIEKINILDTLGAPRIDYTDSGLLYQGVATDVISGLDHLEGETVAVLADGASHRDRVVSGGEITLEREATDVTAGLEIEGAIRPNPLDTTDAPLGGVAGFPRGYGSVYLRLVDSVVPLVEGDQSPLRTPSMPMNTVPPLVTKDLEVQIEGFEAGFVPRISVTIPKNLRIIGMFAKTEFGGL